MRSCICAINEGTHPLWFAMFQHITHRHPPVVQPILDLLSKQLLLLRAQLCPRVLSHTRADDESSRLATLLPHPGQLRKTSSSIPAHSAVVGFQCDITVALGGDRHMPLGTHGWFFRGCRGCGKGSLHSPVMAGYHSCQYICIVLQVNPTTFTNEVMPNSHIRFDRRHVDDYKQARGLLLQPPCIVLPYHPQRDTARNLQWTFASSLSRHLVVTKMHELHTSSTWGAAVQTKWYASTLQFKQTASGRSTKRCTTVPTTQCEAVQTKCA